MGDQEVFGAFALVRIRFDGSIRGLAVKLAEAFNIEGFQIAPNEYPPYNEMGSAEVLGHELWLEASKDESKMFSLRLETEHAVEEVFSGRMYDLSPWLARFLTMMCDIEVTPETPGSP